MRLAPLAASVVLVLALGACSGSTDPEDRPASGEDTEARSQILQPGQPGEPNQTLDPDTTLDSPEWNDADAMFMQMMVPHHAQALEMAELAATRARDGSVASLARRIQGAQGPEIRSMASWLAARGLEVPTSMQETHGDHGGASMMGMLTDAQMEELAAARGPEFDQLFLAGMIQHHQGAVDMAGTQLEEGSDLLALELAADIATGQLAEIRRMEELGEQL